MKKIVTVSLGVLLSSALLAGAYAGQGSAGAVSGQASSETDIKAGSPSQPAHEPLLSPETAGRTATFEGEVLRIKGHYYTVKDASGKSVRLRVDKHTKIDGNIAAHDMVVAHATQMPNDTSTPSDKKQASQAQWRADSIEKR